ncbi:hypothetical protein OG300_05895 [Nocardia sp. NBC_00511]
MTLASAAILASASETTGNAVVVGLLIAFTLAAVILFLAAVVSVLRSRNYASGGKAVLGPGDAGVPARRPTVLVHLGPHVHHDEFGRAPSWPRKSSPELESGSGQQKGPV